MYERVLFEGTILKVGLMGGQKAKPPTIVC